MTKDSSTPKNKKMRKQKKNDTSSNIDISAVEDNTGRSIKHKVTSGDDKGLASTIKKRGGDSPQNTDYSSLKMDRKTLAKFKNKVPGFLELLKSKPIVPEQDEETPPVTAEMMAKMKMKKEKNERMRKKKLAKKMAAATGKPSDLKQKSALAYLMAWSTNREVWSFQKVRQTWLLQNMYDPNKITDEQFEVLLEYVVDLKGSSAVQTIKYAEKVLADAEENIDINSNEDHKCNDDENTQSEDMEESELNDQKEKCKKRMKSLAKADEVSGIKCEKKTKNPGNDDSSCDEKHGNEKQKQKKRKSVSEVDNEHSCNETDDKKERHKKKKRKKMSLSEDISEGNINEIGEEVDDNDSGHEKIKKRKKKGKKLVSDDDVCGTEISSTIENKACQDSEVTCSVEYQRARRLVQILN